MRKLFETIGKRSATVRRRTRSERRPRYYSLIAGVFEIPEAGKANPKGEDVYFLTKHAAAVFDGVGAWYRKGVDPRKYPDDLSSRMLEVVASSYESAGDEAEVSALDIVETAWNSTTEKDGSCTCCAYFLQKDGVTLDVLNLGDSGVVVLRNGKAVLESTMQETVFNMPYQLGPHSRQKPRDAELLRLVLEPDDTVVLATDGLFANMDAKEIADFVGQRSVDSIRECEKLARDLAHKAYHYARDTKRESPYARRACDVGFDEVYGGKMDDITVVISRCVL